MKEVRTDELEAARAARIAEKRTLQTSSRRAHDLIRSSIRMGMVPRSAMLMEHKLVSGLATSRNAVREALQLLATEGLVERSVRTGTRLIGSILEVPIDQFLPLVADESSAATRDGSADRGPGCTGDSGARHKARGRGRPPA